MKFFVHRAGDLARTDVWSASCRTPSVQEVTSLEDPSLHPMDAERFRQMLADGSARRHLGSRVYQIRGLT